MDWDDWAALADDSPPTRARKPRAAPAPIRSAPAPVRPAPAPARPPVRPAPATRAATGPSAPLRLAFSRGTSDKVYELDVTGSTLTVRWGRRGAKLQSKSTTFDSPADARAERDKVYASKVKSGYEPVGSSTPAPAPTPAPAARERRASRSISSRSVASVATSSGPPRGVMLAKAWEGSNPTGWWMSEKLDGMRAYWSGTTLYTRNGNEVACPESFRRLLPPTMLDGELFLGRGKFQEAISIVRTMTPDDKRWAKISYMVFDAPDAPGGFEDRMRVLRAAVAAACSKWSGRTPCPIVFVDQVRCTSPTHLKQHHAALAKQGAEGVMLRRPGSAYTPTRTSDLLKVKDFMDSEAKITGYTSGTGKHAGRLGAYTAKLLDSGVDFKIGTGISDSERDRPLAVGTIVTVRFQELTRDGVPRFPSLVGPRDYD